MAKEKKLTDKDLKQKTATGLIISEAGDITVNDYDDSSFEDLMQDYTNMRNGDSIASTSLQILKLPITAVNFRIEGDNQDLNEFVEFTLNGLRKGFNYLLRHMLLSLDYGFIIFEKVWVRGYLYNGKPVNLLGYLAPIQQHTIYNFIYDDYGRFEGIIHTRLGKDGAVEYIKLNKSELFVLSWDEEFEDVRGRSLLRTSRLPWKAKQDVLISTTRSKVRGAGIPKITVKGSVDERILAKARTIGRTLANSKNAYVLQHENEMDVELLQLQNQNNNVEFLQYLDRQQFFNTLTQFITSGLGENGSRAATEEHKSPYETYLLNIANWIEERINDEIIPEIIDNSYFTGEAIFKLNLPKKIDITKISDALLKLVNARGIKLDEDDEEFLRNMFGLPELTEKKKKEREEQQEEPEEEPKENIEGNSCHIHKVEFEMFLDKNDLNLNKFSEEGKRIFELENAVETINVIGKKAKEEIEDLHKRILKDVARQLSKSKGKSFELRYKREFLSKMKKLYRLAYREGKTDAKKEIAKLKGKQLENIVLGEEDIIEDTRYLELKIEAYYNSMDNQIKSLLLSTSKNSIDKQGGFEQWVLAKFENINKGIRTNIATFTTAGYTKGRNDEFGTKLDEVEVWEYTAVLDKNTCEECAPYDGLRMTLQEIEEAGLNFPEVGNSLNPKCLGLASGNQCRCQLIPVKLKG